MTGSAPIRWMLGLERVPDGAQDARFAFEHPVPPWLVVLALVAAFAIAWASYRRLAIGERPRRALVALRTTTIVTLAALLAGPLLEVPRETVEPDSVVVLADRSRSLEVEDVSGPTGIGSRDAALRALAGPGSPFADAGPEHRVSWFGFSEDLVPLASGAQGVDVGAPVGERTLIASAIERALERSSGRAISAIVLLTDGRTTDPPDRALVRRLQSDGIAVSAIVLGADAEVGDTSVAAVDAPRRAFVRDLVPVEATVERRGPARARAMRVELVDASTGEVSDRSELPPAGQADAAVAVDRVQLIAKPSAAGDARWEVRVSAADGARDLLPANDRRPVPITLVDRPMRVLYVDGYPRWEYRYLKNLLQRERSVESAVMLLSAERDFAQEGNTPISRLPRTREEFDRYDLFVVGDVPASFFTGEQLSELRRAVGDRGAGLLWIGGERSTPRTWNGTSLEDLLPFTGPFELERLVDAVNLRPTALAARSGVLRLADDPRAGFPEELGPGGEPWSRLEWVQRIPQSSLKPAAEVLAESAQQVDGSVAPIVISMRFGAGNAMYVATDEVWRWRHGRGEAYPERFWVQLLRSLARPALGSGNEEVRIAVEPARATVGDPVRIEVELPPGAPPATVALEAVPDDRARATVEIDAAPAPGGGFVAGWIPESEGRWSIRPRDPALAARAAGGASFESVRSDRELRDAEVDRALLEALARETGGRVVGPADAASLVRSLPNRSVRTADPVQDRLWNSPAALALVLSLLGAEWVMWRKARLA